MKALGCLLGLPRLGIPKALVDVLPEPFEIPTESFTVESRGDAVAAMQLKLGLSGDGDFGPATERALMGWQRENGLEPDGIAGPATLARLLG